MRTGATFALALLMTAPVLVSAQVPNPTESMGSHYKTPEEKAMEAYARGMRSKRKAEGEKDPQKQAKLYLKAKEELSKSVGYQGHYDGYLALGQVYLALGKQESAFDACSHAQFLKPNDETAKSCVEEARRKIREASTKKPGDGGR